MKRTPKSFKVFGRKTYKNVQQWKWLLYQVKVDENGVSNIWYFSDMKDIKKEQIKTKIKTAVLNIYLFKSL